MGLLQPRTARFGDVTGAVSVLSTATLIYRADGNRDSLMIYNNGSETIYLGATESVTTSTGYPVTAASAAPWFGVGACYGICATGPVDTRFHNAD